MAEIRVGLCMIFILFKNSKVRKKIKKEAKPLFLSFFLFFGFELLGLGGILGVFLAEFIKVFVVSTLGKSFAFVLEDFLRKIVGCMLDLVVLLLLIF